MHRRNHAGINRIREMPHATADAPKNLTSAAGVVCAHSARPCARPHASSPMSGVRRFVANAASGVASNVPPLPRLEALSFGLGS